MNGQPMLAENLVTVPYYTKQLAPVNMISINHAQVGENDANTRMIGTMILQSQRHT